MLAILMMSLAVFADDVSFSGSPISNRTPSKQPESMGVSVRTAKLPYTEWRDWKTGETTARELYTDADEPAETQSLIDDPSTAADQRVAAELLRRQFPPAAHP